MKKSKQEGKGAGRKESHKLRKKKGKKVKNGC